MRIIQLLPTMSFGDAVSNDAAAIGRMIREMGSEAEIYAENIDGRLEAGTAKFVKDMTPPEEEDVLIYHGSTGDALNYLVPRLKGKKIMRYHNITPPHYFHSYSAEAEKRCANGYREIRRIAGAFRAGVADSDYNRQDMRRLGFHCPIDVCPIVMPWSDYEREPDREVAARYGNDGWTNLLFVGRIAPNKRQENVIRAFHHYHRAYNPKSRLFLVGSAAGTERYLDRLKAYVNSLGLGGRVIFPGQTSFPTILAYYQLADAFICMSEHEGFCVPVIEAMYFRVPIIALRAAAVPETLGKGGLLLDSPDPETAAAAMDRVVRDGNLRQAIRKEQEKRIRDFDYGMVSRRMERSIRSIIGEG